MTPGQLARHLFAEHAKYRLDHLNPYNCKHGNITSELTALSGQSKGLLQVQELGRSFEGRSINLVRLGKGEKRILLWSQMHGDEPTATLALMDIFNHFVCQGWRDEWVKETLEECTIFIVPLLNPDGAERRQRRTTSGIDMNRDARTLVTSEANILRQLQRKLKPRFGFNLHDQELSSVGGTTSVTAIALLAPALDEKKTTPMVRIRAMRVAAFMARTLSHFVEGHLAKYNDAFEPRAFGDNMQVWGTSTVLIESGHWPGDPEKSFIRRLNYVAILSALRAIGNGSYQDVDLDHYNHLPENGKRIYDILVRNITVVHPSGHTFPADLGLSIQPGESAPMSQVVIRDIGDLGTFGALETIEGGKRNIRIEELVLERSLALADLLDTLQLYHPMSA